MQREDLRLRTEKRIDINIALIGVSIAALFFIASLKPVLLNTNLFLTIQLVCSIPILLNSAFAFSKSITARDGSKFRNYGSIFFKIGYAFITNTIGILLFIMINRDIALIFFGINIINPIIYSIYSVKYHEQTISARVIKDGLYSSLVVLLGILVVI